MRALLPLVVLAGCYSTDILVRPPSGPIMAPAQYQDTFHLNILWVFELSAPIDIQVACNGMAIGVHEEQGLIAAIANSILPLGIWNTTALCSGSGLEGPPAPPGGLPPAPPPPPPQ